MYVRDLMTPRVIAVQPTDSLAVARQRLQEHRIHHLLVIDGGKVVGILSYRDLIGRDDHEKTGAVMSRDVVTIEPWDTVRNAAARMLGKTHGCIAVMRGGEVTGVVTTTDLLRAVSSNHSAHA
jgi:acetoin utilization protein AcuB